MTDAQLLYQEYYWHYNYTLQPLLVKIFFWQRITKFLLILQIRTFDFFYSAFYLEVLRKTGWKHEGVPVSYKLKDIIGICQCLERT